MYKHYIIWHQQCIKFRFNLRGTKMQTLAKINPRKISKFSHSAKIYSGKMYLVPKPPSPKVSGNVNV